MMIILLMMEKKRWDLGQWYMMKDLKYSIIMLNTSHSLNMSPKVEDINQFAVKH